MPSMSSVTDTDIRIFISTVDCSPRIDKMMENKEGMEEAVITGSLKTEPPTHQIFNVLALLSTL